jgi:hypothetical protein
MTTLLNPSGALIASVAEGQVPGGSAVVVAVATCVLSMKAVTRIQNRGDAQGKSFRISGFLRISDFEPSDNPKPTT